MTRVRLLVLAAFALLAFSAVSAAVANAEALNPDILCLTTGCATELEATFTGAASKLQALGGKEISGTGVTTELKGCEALPTSSLDTDLCKDITIDFTGVKSGGAACHSEATNGSDKDVAETVLLLLDLHLAAEESLPSMELQPLLLAKVLGPLLEEELFITCGLVKDKVKGVVACLVSPGLTQIAAGGTVTVSCVINTSHDAVTGHCETLCEWLNEKPLLSNLGNGFEDSWEEVTLTGKPNKDIFIDD